MAFRIAIGGYHDGLAIMAANAPNATDSALGHAMRSN